MAFSEGGSRFNLQFAKPVAIELGRLPRPILITGASGWIGRSLLAMLQVEFGESLRDVVIPLTSDGRDLILDHGYVMQTQTIETFLRQGRPISLIVHLAFATKEQLQDLGHSRFVQRNTEITRGIIQIAIANQVLGALVLSSGAVYSSSGILETSIDRNPYGFLKLEEEHKFQEALGIRTNLAIIRLFNLAGPFINKVRHYVIGSILLDLIAGNQIQLLARRPVVRSFVHVADVVNVGVAGALGLVSTVDGPIDTHGDVEVEIQELALGASRLIRPDAMVLRPPMDAKLPADIYVGSGSMFQDSLTQIGSQSLELDQQIRDTYDYLCGAFYK
jgi:UDP-glucuronate decarboxylase